MAGEDIVRMSLRELGRLKVVHIKAKLREKLIKIREQAGIEKN
ncbi:MAG: hypothetical protein V3V99_10825 [candidate division Zixibacteria bacterium]